MRDITMKDLPFMYFVIYRSHSMFHLFIKTNKEVGELNTTSKHANNIIMF